jgi:hypothetical protein
MPRNLTILHSPLLLFLGAGASNPLGRALMQPFVAKLKDTIRKNDPSALSELLNRLIRFRSQDLEEILGELDTIIGLDYARAIEGVYFEANVPQSFQITPAAAVMLRKSIEHEVIREYRTVSPEATVNVYSPLFELIFSHIDPAVQCLPVFTTNYDPAVENFCALKHSDYELTDGFYYDKATREHFWQENVFDGFDLTKGKRNIVLFKLHGSVDWLRVKSADRIRRALAMYDEMDADAYENVLIYPATRKIAVEEPYFTAYDYYQKCCERAKVCLAIGYSFRDYDALTRLRGAMTGNPKLHLALLSPDAQAVLKTLPLPRDREVPFSFLFGLETYLKDYLAAIDQLLAKT